MEVNIHQTLRPLRLAFLVKPNNQWIVKDSFHVLSSLWGGIYFPVIEVRQRLSKKFRAEYRYFGSALSFYNNIIENFDPDVVVFDAEISKDLIEGVSGGRKLVELDKLKADLDKGIVTYGIHIKDVFRYHLYHEYRYKRVDLSTVDLIDYKNISTFDLVRYGNPCSHSLNEIKKLVEENVNVKFHTDREEFLESKQNSLSQGILDVARYKINELGNPFWTSKSVVLVIDSKRTEDLVLFWNLRALGYNILPIDYKSYKDERLKTDVEIHQKIYSESMRFENSISVIGSYTINKDEYDTVFKYLQSLESEFEMDIKYSIQGWIPRFWGTRQELNWDRSASLRLMSNHRNTVQNHSYRQRLEVLKPEFLESVEKELSPKFVNTVEVSFEDEFMDFAQVLPDMNTKDLDFIYRGSGFNQWRFSALGVFFLSTNQDQTLEFALPSSRELFESFYKYRGHSFKYSSAGRLGKQLFRNIGGIYGTNFFANAGILPILELFENGKVVAQSNLFGTVKKNIGSFRNLDVKDIIERLLAMKLIEFGAKIQCLTCSQRSFFLLSELEDILTCKVCQSRISVPSNNPNDIKWTYRGVGTFSRNNKSDGILSVLLTLRFFRIGLHETRISTVFSTEIIQRR